MKNIEGSLQRRTSDFKMNYEINMRKNTKPGTLISFCGINGSGKTTMLNKTEFWLKEQGFGDISRDKQPTVEALKKQLLKEYIKQPEYNGYDYRSLALIEAADKIQHNKMYVKPALARGAILLSDGYFYTCIANLRARGFKKDSWIFNIAECVIKPDISIFLDIDEETALERVKGRDEIKSRFVDKELQKRLRNEYLELAEKSGAKIISTAKNKKECFNELTELLEKYFEDKK